MSSRSKIHPNRPNSLSSARSSSQIHLVPPRHERRLTFDENVLRSQFQPSGALEEFLFRRIVYAARRKNFGLYNQAARSLEYHRKQRLLRAAEPDSIPAGTPPLADFSKIKKFAKRIQKNDR